ncbi:WD40 repeat domain-containing protein, partial [Kibdelosporangium lantanae]
GDVVLPPQRGPRSLALASDVVYVSTGEVSVWKSLECLDLTTGREAHQYPDHERVERLFGGGAAPVFISRKLDDQYAVYELTVPDKPWRFDPDRIWFFRRPRRTRFVDYSVAVGSDETVVAAVGEMDVVYWRLSATDVHHRRLPVRIVSSCVALVDGKVLLLVEVWGDSALALVDVDSGEVLWLHQGRWDWTTSPCVAQVDGRAVGVTGGMDSAIVIVDLLTGNAIGQPLVGHSMAPDAYDVVTYEDRPLLVSGGDDRTVRVWDLRTHVQLVVIDMGAVVTSVKFVPSTQAIIVGTEASVLRIELDHI